MKNSRKFLLTAVSLFSCSTFFLYNCLPAFAVDSTEPSSDDSDLFLSYISLALGQAGISASTFLGTSGATALLSGEILASYILSHPLSAGSSTTVYIDDFTSSSSYFYLNDSSDIHFGCTFGVDPPPDLDIWYDSDNFFPIYYSDVLQLMAVFQPGTKFRCGAGVNYDSSSSISDTTSCDIFYCDALYTSWIVELQGVPAVSPFDNCYGLNNFIFSDSVVPTFYSNSINELNLLDSVFASIRPTASTLGIAGPNTMRLPGHIPLSAPYTFSEFIDYYDTTLFPFFEKNFPDAVPYAINPIDTPSSMDYFDITDPVLPALPDANTLPTLPDIDSSENSIIQPMLQGSKTLFGLIGNFIKDSGLLPWILIIVVCSIAWFFLRW